MNRRDLLSAAALSLALPQAAAFARFDKPTERPIHDEEPQILDDIAAMLATAGTKLGPGSRTVHYRVVDDFGDAHETFLGKFCETLLAHELDMFRLAGLAPTTPQRRLSIVMLDQDVFFKLAKSEGVSEGAGGFYSRRTRACFVSRIHRHGNLAMPIDWENTLTVLSHEATHQITYNTGILHVEGDIPACISEGLGVVGEATTREIPRILRQVNRPRLERLLQIPSRSLIPLDEFFDNDDHLWNVEAHLDHGRWTDAYCWAWWLVYILFTQDDLRPRFRSYLNAIATRKDKSHRIADARTHLGDLASLHDRLIRRLRWLSANPPSKYKSYRRF